MAFASVVFVLLVLVFDADVVVVVGSSSVFAAGLLVVVTAFAVVVGEVTVLTGDGVVVAFSATGVATLLVVAFGVVVRTVEVGTRVVVAVVEPDAFCTTTGVDDEGAAGLGGRGRGRRGLVVEGGVGDDSVVGAAGAAVVEVAVVVLPAGLDVTGAGVDVLGELGTSAGAEALGETGVGRGRGGDQRGRRGGRAGDRARPVPGRPFPDGAPPTGCTTARPGATTRAGATASLSAIA